MRRIVTVIALCVCLCVYLSVCFALCVCLFVNTRAAEAFIFTIKLWYEQLQFSILFILNSWIFKKCFVHKLYCHLLTVTDSPSIAETLVSFFSDGGGL